MPDPEDFSAVLVMNGYAGLKGDVLRTVTKLNADGQRLAAEEIGGAFEELTARLQLLATEVAEIAQESILDHEQTSRVRPDTAGDGGPRLEDFIGESRPFAEVPGTVLINDERALDEGGVGWWWTNEEGYSGFVGRRLQGYFFDAGFTGKTRPSMDRSREHPLFGGRMVDEGQKGAVIRNPIPAREFVLHGFEEAQVEWHRQVRAAKARFDQRVARASVLARQPRVP